ncbi:MAG TPA: ABC transporter ATP-binding protein [Chloroflexia bacterium]|nr:ABC transporter ATP-binding protein [Chloroflexia bacterium]
MSLPKARGPRLRWLVRYPGRRRAWVGASLLTMLVQVGLDVLKPWPLKIIVDQVLSGKPLPAPLRPILGTSPGRESLLAWCVGGTVGLFLLAWVVGLAREYANMGLRQRLVYDLAGDLFRHLERLSLGFHRRKAVGDSIRRVTADCTCVAIIVNDALLPVVTALVSLIVMFTLLWQLDPELTALALLVVPYMAWVFRRYAQPMLDHSYRQQAVEGQIYDVVEQTLSAMPVVQAFGGEAHADRRLRARTRAARLAALATTRVQLRFKVLMGLATAGGTATILWFGGSHVLGGRLTVGSMLVFLAYLAALYSPLESLMYMSSTVQGALGSAERVREVLQLEPEVRDRPSAPRLPRVRGHVGLEGVTVGYEPGRPVLHAVTLEIRPGETVALVGPTGAGKSTLAGLVPRLFDPWEGIVRLDGHDLRTVQIRSVRDQIAIVLQEPFILPRTVAENIAYARPGAGRATIEAAARAANAHVFIERLPAGYDTVLGERGATLSGGERQRLAIARALLKDAPILILDEPTSALDTETEQLVLDALRRLMAGRTCLVIAHRLSTVREAHRIVVLEAGRLVQAGTHDDLVAAGGTYARYSAIQFGSPPAVLATVGQE